MTTTTERRTLPGDQTQTAEELEAALGHQPALEGHHPRPHRRRRRRPAGLACVEERTLARRGAEMLWDCCTPRTDYVNALGALTGNQAVQQVRAGLKAIYLSGWQVAADANLSGHTYPDQSLYPANSVPPVVRRINNALLRADQIERRRGRPLASRTGWPDRRRRRGRLRWRAQRLRAAEGA